MEKTMLFKNRWVWFGLGLLWGAALVFAGSVFFLRSNLIAETECPLPWERPWKNSRVRS